MRLSRYTITTYLYQNISEFSDTVKSHFSQRFSAMKLIIWAVSLQHTSHEGTSGQHQWQGSTGKPQCRFWGVLKVEPWTTLTAVNNNHNSNPSTHMLQTQHTSRFISCCWVPSSLVWESLSVSGWRPSLPSIVGLPGSSFAYQEHHLSCQQSPNITQQTACLQCFLYEELTAYLYGNTPQITI